MTKADYYAELSSKGAAHLDEIIKKSNLILIDTCSFMQPIFPDFIRNLLPLLEKYNKKLTVCESVRRELRSKRKRDYECDSPYDSLPGEVYAMTALEVYDRLHDDFKLVDSYDIELPNGTPTADKVFQSICVRERDLKRILLITQDKELSKTILSFNNDKSLNCPSKISVEYITMHGWLAPRTLKDLEKDDDDYEKVEKSAKADKLEKAGKSERTGKQDKSDKLEKSEKSDKSSKVEKAAKAEKPEKLTKAEQKAAKAAKTKLTKAAKAAVGKDARENKEDKNNKENKDEAKLTATKQTVGEKGVRAALKAKVVKAREQVAAPREHIYELIHKDEQKVPARMKVPHKSAGAVEPEKLAEPVTPPPARKKTGAYPKPPVTDASVLEDVKSTAKVKENPAEPTSAFASLWFKDDAEDDKSAPNLKNTLTRAISEYNERNDLNDLSKAGDKSSNGDNNINNKNNNKNNNKSESAGQSRPRAYRSPKVVESERSADVGTAPQPSSNAERIASHMPVSAYTHIKSNKAESSDMPEASKPVLMNSTVSCAQNESAPLEYVRKVPKAKAPKAAPVKAKATAYPPLNKTNRAEKTTRRVENTASTSTVEAYPTPVKKAKPYPKLKPIADAEPEKPNFVIPPIAPVASEFAQSASSVQSVPVVSLKEEKAEETEETKPKADAPNAADAEPLPSRTRTRRSKAVSLEAEAKTVTEADAKAASEETPAATKPAPKRTTRAKAEVKADAEVLVSEVSEVIKETAKAEETEEKPPKATRARTAKAAKTEEQDSEKPKRATRQTKAQSAEEVDENEENAAPERKPVKRTRVASTEAVKPVRRTRSAKQDASVYVIEDNIVPGETELMIPDGYTTVRSVNWQDRNDLRSVKLPDGLRTIEKETFSGCMRLQEVEIPSSVTEIGPGAFKNCRELKRVKLPERIKSISGQSFAYCFNLSELEIPKNVTQICTMAFRGCTNLRRVTILGDVDFIAQDAFPNDIVIYCNKDSATHTAAIRSNLRCADIATGEWLE